MKKLIVDSFTNKTKFVVTHYGEIKNIFIIDKLKPTIVGNVYLGRVEKIVNKQFCFVVIGKDEKCFIDFKDSKEKYFLSNVKEGSKVLVEIVKDKTHDKVAKGSLQVNFWDKGFLHIFKSENKEIRVSKSIRDKAERQRLKDIGNNIYDGYSILFRTSSNNFSEAEITEEYKNLVAEAENTLKKSSGIMPPYKIYEKSIYKNIVNLANDVDEIIVNDKNLYNQLLNKFTNQNLIFKDDIIVDYSLQLKIDKLFNKKVWLKSGGFIYIEETESAVLIDVNSGKFTKSKNADKVVLKTNLEALEVAFQEIKLRNLSGIILIDLINIRKEEDKETIVKKVKELSKLDENKITIAGITDLFLLQLTRKKELGSLSSSNSIPCPYCKGDGKVLDFNFVCDKIFREIYWFGVNTNKKDITLKANSILISAFLEKNKFLIDSLKEKFNINIHFVEINSTFYDYFEIL